MCMCVDLELDVHIFVISPQHIILQTFIFTGNSQQCVDITASSTFDTIIIVEGGVQTCFRCLFNGAVDPSTTWTFSTLEQPVGSNGMVTAGVLTVFDPTTIVPQAGARTIGEPLRCTTASSSQYTILLNRRGVCVCVCVCVCVETRHMHPLPSHSISTSTHHWSENRQRE